MTIREYISQKLHAFGDISEAELLDMSLSGGFSLDDEYLADVEKQVGISLIGIIGEKAVSPYLKSVNESGFSVSWDRDNIGKYYLWLCKKYGVTPDDSVTDMLGVSIIKDRSNIW